MILFKRDWRQIVRSLYWVVRYFYAKKHADSVFQYISEYKPLKTPFLLKLMHCKLLEVRYDSDNKHSFTGIRWLIVRDDRKIEIPTKIFAWRIQGCDTNSKIPMVVWERNA